MKKPSFGNAPQTMYQWSRSLEIFLGTNNYALLPMKWAKIMKKAGFGDARLTMY
jgi:hypothetical protein